MLNSEVNIALNKFAKYVVMQSRANLTRKNKSVSRKLYESIKADLQVGKNSFGLSFLMEDYGDFQDKGVRGANPSLVKNGIQKAPNSPFEKAFEKLPKELIEAFELDLENLLTQTRK